MIPLRFTAEDAVAAYEAWRFNCGPGALCAVLGMTPGEVRPHLLDFERKGYSNPTLVLDVLRGLDVPHRLTYRCDAPCDGRRFTHGYAPDGVAGLVRVQWGGPWTRPGVPMRARYRHTHWAAFHGTHVYDVNHPDGWLPLAEWRRWLLPLIISHGVPKADGSWWPTHVIEVEP